MNGVMARPADDPEPRRDALGTRLVSAVVLAVPVLLTVHIGFPAFEAMVVVGSALLVREWLRMCLGAKAGTPLLRTVVFAACVGPALLAAGGRYEAGAAVVAAGIVSALAAGRRGAWPAVGILYIAVPCMAFLWLRNAPVGGRDVVFWLLAVVWATDIGAFACGRLIGGWRLAPALSPNKTWAGFVGGIGIGAVAGTAFIVVSGGTATWLLALAGAVLGVAAQGGDLLESSFKRRFGVKDAGGLIPGHGGLLDRVDGLMAATAFAALIGILGGGSIRAWL